MTNKKLISVIVPVYNVSKYIKKCVDSIINQTYSNLEIILVDDGSTDESGEICNQLKEKDERIVVIHKKNGGQSSARNAGLNNCHGDYIGFVDSDDYIEPNMYEILMNLLDNKTNCVSCIASQSEYENGIKTNIHNHHNRGETIEEYLQSCLLHKGDVSVCTKLFPKTIIGTNRFDENRLNEDILFMFLLTNKFDSIIYDNYIGYHYIERKDSTARTFGKAIHDMVYNAFYIKEFIDINFPELRKQAERFLIYQNLSFAWSVPLNYDHESDPLCKLTIEFLRKKLLAGMNNPFFSNKDKLRIFLISFFPKGTIKIYSMLKSLNHN